MQSENSLYMYNVENTRRGHEKASVLGTKTISNVHYYLWKD